ncbi:hypothetical protein [Phenylobacterium sp.]|jgi:hypothetical protein|uniref:hypothetical protein n=1 Tax=Phenylobacterium sp. TaxID=1871053 RepID=UPI002E3709A3|nr:hypothetical protein [Phenylobacterium sp.]HEX4712663.1 hypothetical protein [Phenylobacterium sp.]
MAKETHEPTAREMMHWLAKAIAFTALSSAYWWVGFWVLFGEMAADCFGSCRERRPLAILAVELVAFVIFTWTFWTLAARRERRPR